MEFPMPVELDEDQLEDETFLAMRIQAATEVLNDVADYMEANDIDKETMKAMNADPEAVDDAMFIFALTSLAQPMKRIGEQVAEDDDDENPFRVN